MSSTRKKDVTELITGEAGRATLNWSSETDEEQAARLRISEEDARHARKKDMITHVALTVALLVVGAACLYGSFFPAHPETRQFATAGASAILTGAVGYFTGRAAR